MSPRPPLPVLTDARRAWLLRLRDEGPAKRPPRSRIGYDCMQLGWTEWYPTDLHSGERITYSEARLRYPEGETFANTKLDDIEIITAKGRAALEEVPL